MSKVKSVWVSIAITTLVLSPVTVLAQNAQINTQDIYNGAQSVGSGNVIDQGVIQQGVQSQLEVTGTYDPSQLQVPSQGANNLGSTDGYLNYVDQYGYQDSNQIQTQVDSYLGY
jgi:hypothetical protein